MKDDDPMYRWAVDWLSKKARKALEKAVPEDPLPEEYYMRAIFDTEAEALMFAREILADDCEYGGPIIMKQRQDSLTGHGGRTERMNADDQTD
jgi:hypothetical protein